MLSDLDILCFANDWSADPTSKHHLMGRLAATNRILWIEAAGMRAPDLRRRGDLQRLVRKARAVWRRPRQVRPTLHVYSPPVLPFPRSRIARAANRSIYRVALQYQLQRLGLSDRKSTRLNSSHTVISYAVFCLKKKKTMMTRTITLL